MDVVAVFLSFLSLLGAAGNGYGSGKDEKRILFYGQLTWCVSNTLWVLYSIYQHYWEQIPMFLSFGIAAYYSVYHMYKE